MKKFVIATAALFLAASAHADILTLTPTNPPVKNTGVTVSSGAKTSAGASLTTVGAALRQKQVIFASNIYVGELLVSDSSRYVKTVAGALPSLENEDQVALVLHILFIVPTQLLVNDLNAQAGQNGIAADDADYKAFSDIVKGFSYRPGVQFTILFSRNADGTQTMSLENKAADGSLSASQPVKVSAQGKHKILSLWLGNTNDTYLKTFQTDLMK
jgi:hypothetical protein